MALRLASRQARLVVFGYNAITSKICWTNSPETPQYAGSPLSLAGGQVMAFYKDGTVSDITDVCGYEPSEGSPLRYGGELTINARYTDHAGNQFSDDTKIQIADVEKLIFSGLANPIQKEGERLDLTGAVLSAQYTDGTVRAWMLQAQPSLPPQVQSSATRKHSPSRRGGRTQRRARRITHSTS